MNTLCKVVIEKYSEGAVILFQLIYVKVMRCKMCTPFRKADNTIVVLLGSCE
jgi:hypothetical protein